MLVPLLALIVWIGLYPRPFLARDRELVARDPRARRSASHAVAPPSDTFAAACDADAEPGAPGRLRPGRRAQRARRPDSAPLARPMRRTDEREPRELRRRHAGDRGVGIGDAGAPAEMLRDFAAATAGWRGWSSSASPFAVSWRGEPRRTRACSRTGSRSTGSRAYFAVLAAALTAVCVLAAWTTSGAHEIARGGEYYALIALRVRRACRAWPRPPT